jgi:hypothetical protein
MLARQTDGAAVELPPEQAVIPALWRANEIILSIPIITVIAANVHPSIKATA